MPHGNVSRHFIFLLHPACSLPLVLATVDLLLSIVLCYHFTDLVFDKKGHKHLGERFVMTRSPGFYISLSVPLSSAKLTVSMSDYTPSPTDSPSLILCKVC